MAGRVPLHQTPREAIETVAIVDSVVSVSTVLGALRDLTPAVEYSTQWRRKLAADELFKIPKLVTPYGAICQEAIAPGKAGPLSIYHVRPQALLSYATESSLLFFTFLKNIIAASPDGMVDICYYLDKAKPGHNKRPDTARSTQCIYWSVLEFPHWFVSRRNGWIPFAYVPVQGQDDSDLTDGMLVKFVVRAFDSPESDIAFSKGFAVKGPNGDFAIVKARRQLMVADWEQHVKTFSLKGYNGSVPCGVCKNVMGRCEYFIDDYLVHIHSSEYHKFDRHTTESFAELAHSLQYIAHHEAAALPLEEQSTGIKYDEHGILWDDEVRARLQYPMCAYPDWMHHFCASGGLAQYEVNGVILKLESMSIRAADIDVWKNTVRLPRGSTKLSKKFFQDRIVQNFNGHIRAYASEVLTVVVVLGFFLDVNKALFDNDSMLPYLDCFDLLRIMLGIFQRGDRDDLPTLRIAMQSHHELYMSLYHGIAKVHGQVHIVDYWEYWGPLLSCFGPERHHKLFKKVCSYSYNKFEKSTLAHDVRTWAKALSRPQLYQPIHLSGKLRQCRCELRWPGCRNLVIVHEWSGSLTTEHGLLAKGDVVQYKAGASVCIAFAVGFARSDSTEVESYLAVVEPCQMISASIWRKTENTSVLQASSIVGSVPWVSLPDDTIGVMLHPGSEH